MVGEGRGGGQNTLIAIPEAMRPNDRGDLVQTGGGVTEGWMKRGERTFQTEGTARAKAPRCEAVWPLRGMERGQWLGKQKAEG